jgi:hypothetical protein
MFLSNFWFEPPLSVLEPGTLKSLLLGWRMKLPTLDPLAPILAF